MSDERLEVLLSEEQISQRVAVLAEAISQDYANKKPLLLCVLKGAVFFFADLLRNLSIAPEIDFVAASSYEGDASAGRVSIQRFFNSDIAGKDVLIIEDILDTGLTYETLADMLRAGNPGSLGLCVLLDKPSDRRKKPIRADYVGFTIPDEFVVGYGLDYREKYRELPDICILSI